MALRDIFDSDPRSKDQLRNELAVQRQHNSDLSARIQSLNTASIAAAQKADNVRMQLQLEIQQSQALREQLSEMRASVTTVTLPEPAPQSQSVSGQDLDTLLVENNQLKRQVQVLDVEIGALKVKIKDTLHNSAACVLGVSQL